MPRDALTKILQAAPVVLEIGRLVGAIFRKDDEAKKKALVRLENRVERERLKAERGEK